MILKDLHVDANLYITDMNAFPFLFSIDLHTS